MGAALVAAGAWAAANAAAIAAAAAVASAAISYKMTSDANKNAEEAAEKQNKLLNEEAIRQYGELDKAEADAIYESHATSLEAQKQFLEARSSVQLQAAVTGTYGNSVNIALQDIKTGFGGRMADIINVRESQLDEIDNIAERVQAGVGASQATAIKKPAFWGAVQTGLSTYQTVSGIARSAGSAAEQAGKVGSGATGVSAGPMSSSPRTYTDYVTRR